MILTGRITEVESSHDHVTSGVLTKLTIVLDYIDVNSMKDLELLTNSHKQVIISESITQNTADESQSSDRHQAILTESKDSGSW